ncbi:MAG: 50S ribosomal protein L5 [uncultured bacterium]|nr:MAG: 50S ribosomal protein L5 [uncultured bacterium]HBD05275.1 50S ribosomal protein L5 [Candidatus Uhrbacteria bacterium]
MTLIKEKYMKSVVKELQKQFGYSNIMAVPKITKVTLNVGVGAHTKDAQMLEMIEKTLTVISGQRPVKTLARKSIASFKVREGTVVGMMVTIRGKRMWDFIDKLVNVSFARVRDFRGIDESAIDKNGNFSYGFKENVAFPEVTPEEIPSVHGLQVNITTTAKTHEEGVVMFKLLGFPLKERK